jgi:nanoRNase/pAp phosphatase (c-di-AMP/oligoRNAs hydrolase)
VIPDIVIDHHPYRRSTSHAKLIDIRSGYGATATILFEYLKEAGVKPDPPLATAIIYAIRSDTQDLGMESTQADIDAFQCLFPVANKRMLSLIQRGQVQREYFQIIVDGLREARAYGRSIITSLGDILIPDMTGEIADLLLRDDQATWAMCYAYYDGKMLISVRTSETDLRADKVMEYVVARRGKGGGHATLGGGNIILKKNTPSERISVEQLIQKRLLDILKIDDTKGSLLLEAKN